MFYCKEKYNFMKINDNKMCDKTKNEEKLLNIYRCTYLYTLYLYVSKENCNLCLSAQ